MAGWYTPARIRVMLADLNVKGVGSLGEALVWRWSELAGYRVQRPVGRMTGDLWVGANGGWARVEVKIARRSKDSKWRFTLYKQGHTDHRYSDVVVLLAALVTGVVIPFVVPAIDLNGRQAVITSDPRRYAGKLAVYRQKTGVLDYSCVPWFHAGGMS